MDLHFKNVVRQALHLFGWKTVLNTKLALRIDENLINQATAYAAKQGRSVSALAETYLAQL